MVEESDLRQARLKKMSEIVRVGMAPYPATAQRTHTSQEALDSFDDLLEKEIFLVGRIHAIRSHGGSTFFRIKDGSGEIQAYLRKDVVGQDKYKLFSNFDIGDFIQIQGKLFVTKKGEKTLEVADYTILTKSLRPLPEKWHGLKDVEERFRKRYLDLAVNPEIKERFELRSAMIEKIRQVLITKGYI